MRPNRPAPGGVSRYHLARWRALQAVLALFFSRPRIEMCPAARRPGNFGMPGSPSLSRIAQVGDPSATAGRCRGARPRGSGCRRFKSCLQLASDTNEYPHKKVTVDSTLAPDYNLSDQPGRGVLLMPTWGHFACRFTTGCFLTSGARIEQVVSSPQVKPQAPRAGSSGQPEQGNRRRFASASTAHCNGVAPISTRASSGNAGCRRRVDSASSACSVQGGRSASRSRSESSGSGRPFASGDFLAQPHQLSLLSLGAFPDGPGALVGTVGARRHQHGALPVRKITIVISVVVARAPKPRRAECTCRRSYAVRSVPSRARFRGQGLR